MTQPAQAGNNSFDNLYTIDEDGVVPDCRIATASQAKQIYDQMWQADNVRSRKRALVAGLVDGNPPYRQADLVADGRDYQCNVNWRIAEAYLNQAVGAFYDLFSEAETYATVRTKSGTPEQVEKWSNIITEEFDRMLRDEPRFDYHMSMSQSEMVKYGAGPLVFQDEFDWLARHTLYGQVKVPERAKSDTYYWDVVSVEIDYQVDELYDFIRNEKAAKALGWDVEQTKLAIIRANPDYNKGGQYMTWEWNQSELKNGSFNVGFRSKKVRTAHMFWREFPKAGDTQGRITHGIILTDDTPTTQKDGRGGKEAYNDFLFKKVGRYEDWCECIHPMYYDRGQNGMHHSVTGMGTKMYSAMEYQNRLLCNLADKAFSPKMMFMPTTASQADEFSLQQFGEYSVLGAGFQMIQTPISGVMEEGVYFNSEISSLINSNLSQYRSAPQKQKGNPETATKVEADLTKEARLQKTQMARYYQQQDALYYEMYRRATRKGLTKSMQGGEAAMDFQERCTKRGVPKDALYECDSVRATRVIGQGSEIMRQKSVEYLFDTVMPRLPETGQSNLINDMISSRAGQAAVSRYNPDEQESVLKSDQFARAMSQVADMKTGTPAVPTATQDPLIFAQTFLKAGDEAAASLSQGGNPQEVAAFLELDGPAIKIHLDRMANDPTRKESYSLMLKQWTNLGRFLDALLKDIQQKQQEEQEHADEMEQQAAQQNSEMALAKQRQDFELQLKSEKTRQGMRDKQVKTSQSLTQKQQSHDQSLVLDDASTAAKIRQTQALTVSKIQAQKAKPKGGDK